MKKLLILLCPTIAFAGTVEVGFSPEQTSLPLVLKTINSAKSSICIATYSSKPIALALIKAKNHGVKIKIVSDQKGNSGKYTATTFLANQGLDVRLNGSYAIMHDKFIVVDDQTLETGSFNYTDAAVKKNAENVVVMWDYPDVASRYANECSRLYNEATPLAKSY